MGTNQVWANFIQMSKPGEHKTVQARILAYAQEIGWTIVPREEAEQRRGGAAIRNSSLFFDDLLDAKVREFNPRYAEAEGALLGQFRRLPSSIYGNREFVEHLRNRGKFFDHEEKRERDLILIDYDEPGRNVYEVTEEWAFHNGHYGTREDVVFLINGIPVLVVECKNASKDEAIALGVDQIRRYHRETPELFVSQQIFTATDAIGFSYGVSWNTVRRNIFDWKGEQVFQPVYFEKTDRNVRSPFDVDEHRRNLPHWQQGEVWVFVTWRLGDSLPKVKLDQWKEEREIWLSRHPEPWDKKTEAEYHDRFSQQIDEWLDQGSGSCVLKEPANANIVAEALRHFDGERYVIASFVVMPNHVHGYFGCLGIMLWRSSLKQEGIGWTSQFVSNSEPTTYCGFIIRARLNDQEMTDPSFLTFYFRSDDARRALIASSGKVAITNISQGILSKAPIPLPPLPEQKKITHILSIIQQKVDNAQSKKSKLEDLFRTLLHELMTAKIRAPELHIPTVSMSSLP